MAVQLRWSLNKAEVASHEGYSNLIVEGFAKGRAACFLCVTQAALHNYA